MNEHEFPWPPSARPRMSEGKWHRLLEFRLGWLAALCSRPAWRENLPIAALLAAYMAAVYTAHIFFGIHGKLVLVTDMDWFARFVLTFAAIFIGLHLRRRSYVRYFEPRALAGFLFVVVSMPLFKSAFASFKQTIPLIHPFGWDPALMRMDRALHFGRHPWELLEPILAHPGLLRLLDYLYLIWFPVLFGFCLWMGWTRRRRLRLHYFLSTLLVWGVLGSVLGTVFASAGPCYYSKVVGAAGDHFAPLMSRLTEIHGNVLLWALHNQTVLWDAYEQDVWMQFGGISAMPSIHVAMATIFALAAFDVHRWLGVFFVAYLCAIQLGSVVLGWHYGVDGYAAMILTLLIWKGVGEFVARWSLENAEGAPRGAPS